MLFARFTLTLKNWKACHLPPSNKRFLHGEHDMNILKRLEKRLLKNPQDPTCQVFQRLIKALCNEGDFKLAEIYELEYDDFELSLEIIKHWRLDRYTNTKERLRELIGINAE